MPFQDPGSGDLPPPYEPGGKAGRPGPGPPPGGGPGGGPFGGPGSAVGGGGLNPQILRTLQGLGESLPVILKRRGLPLAGMTPGPPGKSDTVPAMLTPGEMVMNTGATSQPEIAQLLAMLNMQGAQQMGGQPQGYEQGGMVQGNYCPHCGQPHPMGFAGGGMVPIGGGSISTTGGPAPPAPSTNGFNFGGGILGGNRPGGWGNIAPKPPGAGAPGGPGGSWGGGGYTYNPEGGVTNVNPNDPWGTYNQNRDPSFTGQGARTLGGFGGAGYFDPRGNQMLLNAANEGAQGTADALVRRQTTQADLSGLDPAQRAVAKQQALRDTGRGVQDIMANTRAGVLGNQNDFAQNLYSQLLQGSLGQIGQTNQARLNDWQAGNQQNRQNQAGGGFWGQLAGQVGGAALPFLFPGGGIKRPQATTMPVGGAPVSYGPNIPGYFPGPQGP